MGTMMTVMEATRGIREGTLSPVELLERCLERIKAAEPILHAWVHLDDAGARTVAEERAAEATAGKLRGPLHGIPVGVKDVFHVAGMPTTAGAGEFAHERPAEDAAAVARLRAAGAVIVGKTATTEFAYTDPPATCNPWNVEHTPGGSSSGSAAAVAARMVPFALGSQTVGSVLRPAAYCGVVGYKPAHGIIPTDGVVPLAWSLDHVGPMARSAADCALMLREMAGRDPKDSTTSVRPVPDYSAALSGDIRGLRVGLLRSSFLESAGVVLRQAVEHAVSELAGLGAKVEEVSLSLLEAGHPASLAVITSEALAYHATWLRERPGDYQRDVRERLRVGAFVSGVQYVQGQRVRAMIRDEVTAALRSCDVLVAPTTPIVATAVGQTDVTIEHESYDVRSALTRYTRHFNMSGHPVCSVPCGFTAAGLPIGMQIVGRPFDEATVLRVADAYQRATDWHTRRPPLGADRPAPASDTDGPGSPGGARG